MEPLMCGHVSDFKVLFTMQFYHCDRAIKISVSVFSQLQLNIEPTWALNLPHPSYGATDSQNKKLT